MSQKRDGIQLARRADLLEVRYARETPECLLCRLAGALASGRMEPV
jgi:hypothetical protein